MSQPIKGLFPIPAFCGLSYDHRPYGYALFSSGGSLLYVGVTERIRKRLMTHYYLRRDYGVLRWEAVRFETRADAERWESRAIRELAPALNVAGRDL